ncbi:MAG: D-sedoheptulose 7-phosphate isomerase [Candidatus Omnitrophota bacterium]
MKEKIKKIFKESIDTKKNFLSAHADKIELAAKAIISCYRRGNKVLLFGNGGSAADSQHIAAELLGRFRLDRKPLPAIALNVNTSVLTALANDFGYDETFARQLEGIGKPGDIAIGISTSGNSPNVVKALKKARAMKLVAVAFSGGNGGKLKDAADICLTVPSKNTPRVQETHILLGHIICELVEEGLFKS